MQLVIYPPVASAEYADKVARAVERGALKIMPHWTSRAACQSELDRYHVRRGLLTLQGLYEPTAAIVSVAGEAERGAIPPALPVPSMVAPVDGFRLSSSTSPDTEGASRLGPERGRLIGSTSVDLAFGSLSEEAAVANEPLPSGGPRWVGLLGSEIGSGSHAS